MTTLAIPRTGTLPEEVTNAVLRDLGMRFTTTNRHLAVATFQAANRLDDERLVIDGDAGKRTSRLLRLAHEGIGGNNLSEHFGWDEWTCRCEGREPGCRGVLLTGAMIDGAELLRSVGYRDGLHPGSPYRCPGHNAKTPGSATNSCHQWGGALDVPARLRTKEVVDLGAFAGIGYSPSRGTVVHVDTRGQVVGRGRYAVAVSAPAMKGATVRNPAVFPDGR